MNGATRILLVEDFEDHAILCMRALSQSSNRYEVDHVRCGTEVFSKIRDKSYDLILLDYRLPDMSGLEILQRLRSSGCKVPAVMITGEGSESVAAEALHDGVIDYIVKSGNYYAQLDHFVQSSLERYQLEHRMQTLINSMSDEVLVVSREGRVVDANPAACSRAARNKKEIIGMKCYDAFDCKSRQQECPIGRVFESGEAARFMHTYEIEGNKLYIEKLLSPVKDRSGEVAQVIEVSRDVTQKVKAQVELQRAYAELKKLDKLKDEFLQNMTHELKTPITAIIGALQLLQDESAGEEKRKLIDLALRNAWRLNNLISDVLELSKIEAGAQKLQATSFDLNALVGECIAELWNLAGSNEVRLENELQSELKVFADRKSLKQILMNLMCNAIKFNKRGGTVRVFAEMMQDNKSLKIGVADTGIGIPRGEIPRLFQRFYQVEASTNRRYSGTGLGLAVVKKLVELHKGRVWVESEAGEGSTFYFTLPVRE